MQRLGSLRSTQAIRNRSPISRRTPVNLKWFKTLEASSRTKILSSFSSSSTVQLYLSWFLQRSKSSVWSIFTKPSLFILSLYSGVLGGLSARRGSRHNATISRSGTLCGLSLIRIFRPLESNAEGFFKELLQDPLRILHLKRRIGGGWCPSNLVEKLG